MGFPYRQGLTILCDDEPYFLEIIDRDDGLNWLSYSWDNGVPVLQGQPSINDTGTHCFTLRVTDEEGASIEKTFTLKAEAWTRYTPESVPHAWLDEYYTDLVSWYDYEECGYSGAANGVNQVWECYVAGLDPTCATNRFLATIGLDESGRPAVGWTPKLSDEEAAKRTYTILGKTNLTNADWTVVAPGKESDYSFFSVSVEMK